MKQNRTAFTLIELLVVVAIISILAVMLLPALEQAREKARQSICVNNLKQIGTAFSMYIKDNYGWFPIGGVDMPPTSNAIATWTGQIFPYLENREVLLCPSDTEMIQNFRLEPEQYDSNYGINAMFGWDGYNSSFDPILYNTGIVTFGDPPRSFTPWNSGMAWRRLSKVQNPQIAMLVADLMCRWGTQDGTGCAWAMINNTNTAMDFRHNGFANCLFVDGHVAPKTANQCRQMGSNPGDDGGDDNNNGVVNAIENGFTFNPYYPGSSTSGP